MLEKLHQQKQDMIHYLNLKLQIEDWHGVMDAAVDIREIEAQIKIIKEQRDYHGC
jgi:hypothetical protein